MLKQILRSRSFLVLIVGLSLLCLGALARANDNRGDNHNNRYHYRDGRWYGQGEVFVPDLAIGAVVETVPPQGRIVVVGNTRYYYDNTRYYSQSPDGSYVVVAAPTTVVVERPAAPLIQIRL
jgi:hypothetical protein